jgi:serine/threonine protein kinase
MSVGPGRTLGAYRLVDVVGEGSFGQVWKARKVGELQTVAIKLIPKAGKKESEIKGLRQEIDILKTLRHTNIIQMVDAFETSSDFCVVTEFAQGELFEILESDTSLSEKVVQSIARQLVGALHYLHSNRIIHRDMKPQNILIAADGTVKLCDFGFARAMSQDTFVLTSIKGTPLYMAPELVQEKPYTPAVDIWSMGVILYELFVGKPPFYTTSIYKLIKQIVNESPKYTSAMSEDFRSFLEGVLQKDPKKRLGWPDLLQHPFIATGSNDSQSDLKERIESSKVSQASDSNPSSEAGPSTTPFATTSGASTTTHCQNRSIPVPKATSRKLGVSTEKKGNRMQEPVFLDPPQFSPQGSPSPSDGPMGSAIAERLPSGSTQFQNPPIIAILVDADRRIQKGAENPSCILTEPATLEAIKGALNPPSSGRDLKNWCKSQETKFVVMLIDKILSKIPRSRTLQDIDPSGQLTSVLVLLAKSAHLCVGTSPQFSAAASSALRKCDDWVICLETVALCSELISTRGSWAVVMDGCEGIRVWAIRAQCALLSEPTQGASGYRSMPQKLIDRLVAKKIPGRICRCIEDYDNANDEQASAEDKLVVSALGALTSMLPCVHSYSVPDCSCIRKHSPDLENLWSLGTRYVFGSKETVKFLAQSISTNQIAIMCIRLLRLDPRLGRPLLLHRVVESIRGAVGSLLGEELFESVGVTSTDCDIAFIEEQCGARIISLAEREWIPFLSSENVPLEDLSTISGMIASYILLFSKVWSTQDRYAVIGCLRSKMDVIKGICDSSESASSGEMKNLEGCPCTTGVCDGGFKLAHTVILLDHDKAIYDHDLVESAIKAVLSYDFKPMNCSEYPQRKRISPAGVLSCLKIIKVAVENDGNSLELFISHEGLLKTLVFLLSPGFVEHIKDYYCGTQGNISNFVDAAHGTIIAVLQAPWAHASMLCHDPDRITTAYKEQLDVSDDCKSLGGSLYSNIIANVVRLLQGVNLEDCSEFPVMLPSCAALLARMALAYGDDAVATFARSGGLDRCVLSNLLNSRNPDTMIASSLLVVSQLARTATSKSQIQRFMESGIMKLIRPLLLHPSSSSVRARACNLLGNLCRHSDDPYPFMRDLDILSPLLQLCKDRDQSTRKFACFAVGNAGFHSNYLYSDLKPAVKILVGLLHDDEDRTVANAAGALGNLVRNSGELVPEMLTCDAVGTLIGIVVNKDVKNITAFQIALFSLGNLAAHKECHATFEDLNAEEIMVSIQNNSKMSLSAVKYAGRVLTKLSNAKSSGAEARQQQTPFVSSKSRARIYPNDEGQ